MIFHIDDAEIKRIQTRIDQCYQSGTIIEVINDLDEVLCELNWMRNCVKHEIAMVHFFRESW